MIIIGNYCVLIEGIPIGIEGNVFLKNTNNGKIYVVNESYLT